MCGNMVVLMDVLLAIKPEFAEKILDGGKEYEFRRTSFQNSEEIDLIFLYASSPVSKIVGLFTSDRVVEATPAELWTLFGSESGIDDKSRFMSYFEGVDTGFAIQVDQTHEFKDPIDQETVLENFSPPMSFNYLNPMDSKSLRDHVPSSFQTRIVPTDLTRYQTSRNTE